MPPFAGASLPFSRSACVQQPGRRYDCAAEAARRNTDSGSHTLLDRPAGDSLPLAHDCRGAGGGGAARSICCGTRLSYRASRAALLDERDDYHRRWLKYCEEFGDKEDVVVVVQGNGREADRARAGRGGPRAGPAAADLSRRSSMKST